MWLQYYSIHCFLGPLVFVCEWSWKEGNSRAASSVRPDTHQCLPVTFLWHALSQEEQRQRSNGRKGRQEDVGWKGLGGVDGKSAGGLKRDWKVQEKGFISHEWYRASHWMCVFVRMHAQKDKLSELYLTNAICKAVFTYSVHTLYHGCTIIKCFFLLTLSDAIFGDIVYSPPFGWLLTFQSPDGLEICSSRRTNVERERPLRCWQESLGLRWLWVARVSHLFPDGLNKLLFRNKVTYRVWKATLSNEKVTKLSTLPGASTVLMFR